MIFDEEKYVKIGQKIFPLKSKGLSDFFYRDIQIAFGILASYMQKAEDNASHYQNELTKRDSEVLVEYKEKIEPLLKNSIYTMTEQEKKASKVFFAAHRLFHDQNFDEQVYRIYECQLGRGIKCECPICHEVKDITDTQEHW